MSVIQQILDAYPQASSWYDPSDLSTMWQDTAGTVPAVVGQPVARIDDKGNLGLHATQGTVAARPILQVDGDGRNYLQYDGVDDTLIIPTGMPVPTTGSCAVVGWMHESDPTLETIIYSARHGSTNAAYNHPRLSLFNNNRFITRLGSQNTISGTGSALANTPHVGTSYLATDNVTRSSYLDGVLFGSTTAAALWDAGDNPTSILGRGDFHGRIYGLVHVQHGITPADRQAIEAWLSDPPREIPVGLAPSTESAFSVAPGRGIPVGLASSSESAFSVTLGRVIPVGLASSSESAPTLALPRTISIGLAPELDQALLVGALTKRWPIRRIDTHADDAVGRFTSQYDQAAKLHGLARVWAERIQGLEDAAYHVLAGRWVAEAAGVQLDGMGAIVGEPRLGRRDDVYRDAIGVRISINRSGGEPERIIEFMRRIAGAEHVVYGEIHPAAVEIFVQGDVAQRHAESLLQIVPAAIGKLYVEETGGLVPFGFNELGQPSYVDRDGFGELNVVPHEGGAIAELFEV